MLMKTWQRYVFREILIVFLGFLSCFYFIYALIDYSLHMQDFMQDTRVTFSYIILYYLFEFIKRADLLIPLAVLITTIKVLFALNTKGELVALRASGLSVKTILRPFFFLAGTLALFSYASIEWILPSSLTFVDQFQQKHWKSNLQNSHLYTVSLSDQSTLIYRTQDQKKQLLIDVFWLCSSNEIWHMKSLCHDPKKPMGFFADQLKRNQEGHFEKMASFEKYPFALSCMDSLENYTMPISIENQKISTLFKGLMQKKFSPYDYPTALSYFLIKLITPLLSLLVVIAIAPFCTGHRRSFPIFLTYALALFGFIAFFTLLDAAIILSENGIISAFTAIFGPFLICLSIFSYRYYQRIQ